MTGESELEQTTSYGGRNQDDRQNNNREGRSTTQGGRPRGRGGPRRRTSRIEEGDWVDGRINLDYKDVAMMRRFITDSGRLLNRRQTGLDASHQRLLSRQIKRSRYLALLPYTASHNK